MIKDEIRVFSDRFNKDLESIMSALKGGILVEAMRYGVIGDGKRLRPYMLLLAAQAGGLTYEDVLPLMAGIELVHSYSLVHDDLPCMDDDDMRRGKPSMHTAYGEAMAVLCGDALLNYAYEIMLENAVKAKNVGGFITAINCIMVRAGYGGMLGGQSYDVDEELKATFKREDYVNMYSGKTGALFQAAVGAGALASSMELDDVTALMKFGMYLGIAFQLFDDISDIKQDKQGNDVKDKKPCLTMLSLINEDTATDYVKLCVDVAVSTISGVKGCEKLCELAKYLTDTDK